MEKGIIIVETMRVTESAAATAMELQETQWRDGLGPADLELSCKMLEWLAGSPGL